MGVWVRKANSADCIHIARNLRESDIIEVHACGFTPLDAITHSFTECSECKAFIGNDGKPFAIFGVGLRTEFDESRSLWMLATDDIYAHKIGFLKLSKKIIKELIKKYGKMTNFIDVRNRDTQKWLMWLGARFEMPPVPYGVNNEKFIRFEIGGA